MTIAKESAVALKKSMAGTPAAALMDPELLAVLPTGCVAWQKAFDVLLRAHAQVVGYGASPREIGNYMARGPVHT
jgi:hypothetical protein